MNTTTTVTIASNAPRSLRMTARGVIATRTVQRVLQRPLTLEIAAPKGRAVIRIDRIVLQ